MFLRELVNLIKDMVHLLDSALVFRKANAEREKWEKANPEPQITDPTKGEQLPKNDKMADATNPVPDPAQGEQQLNNDEMTSVQKKQPYGQESTMSEQTPPDTEQAPPESTALVVHASVEKDLEEKVFEEEPPSKRLKFLIPNPITTLQNPLNTILPQNISLEQFTDSLLQITSSKYSPTPPRDKSKGKGIATKENPMKDLIPIMKEGGSASQMLNLNQFSISGKKMSLEDAQAQLAEMKRLADLKAEQEKIKKKLKKISLARNSSSDSKAS
ncbi:hypothetical protein Tco_0110583 [Tanacetum coccineum]